MDFTSLDAEYGALLKRGLPMQPAGFAVDVERLRRVADSREVSTSKSDQ